MTIFVTGGSGLLGKKFIETTKDNYDIILTHNSNPTDGTVKCDITNEKEVLDVISKIEPECIMHCAAMTNVDLCEDEQELAYKINGDGTRNLAKASEELGCKIIYVSTDFVFDGKKENYKETDPVNPQGIYAKSKYQGEQELQKYSTNYAIARVSVLYGWNNKPNFTTWVINELRNNNQINIVTDQYNSPTLADNAAEAMLEIYKQDKAGIFHTAGNDNINRYDFTQKIAEVFKLDTSLINPVTSNQFKQKAPRPQNSSLSVEKVKKELGITMETCVESLKRMKKQEENF